MRRPALAPLLRPIVDALTAAPKSPAQPRPVREERPMSEAVLQRQVLAHLSQLAPHAFFWRANTGGAKTTFGGERGQPAQSGYIRFGIPGQADVLGVAAGRFVAIELKAARGRQTPEQRAFQARVEAAGGLYILARSVAEALDPVRSLLTNTASR